MAQSTENNIIESILVNLFHVLPMIHKKLLRMDLGGVTGELSRLHLAIMGMLREEGMAISEVARRLAIPKSQMTHLIDQLVNLDIVVRHPDTNDRRVTNISLTGHGKEVFEECRGMVKNIIREKLSRLIPAELTEMAAALEKLKNIGAKLE
jgi:DNA-binding MarR family transcriptional regulator